MQEDAPHGISDSKDYDIRLFAELLRPSTLSGLICVLISLLTVAGVVAMTNFQGSSFQQDLFGLQLRVEQERLSTAGIEEEFSLSEDYGAINDNFANSNMVRNIPVMAFWMSVGILVYFLVTGIAGALASAKDIGDELNYVHAKRNELLRVVFIKLAIRLATLVIWLLYIMAFFRILIPYALAAANIGGSTIMTFGGILYALLSFAILAFSLHLHVILVRLVVLRPRLFSKDSSF